MFHAGEMIVNYFLEAEDVEGFLYNGGKGMLLRNSSSVEFRPWGIDYGSWDVRYVSFYDCAIGTAGEDEEDRVGIYFYRV